MDEDVEDSPIPTLRDFYYEMRDGTPVLSEDYR